MDIVSGSDIGVWSIRIDVRWTLYPIFKYNCRYLKGGVASGFRHVDLDKYDNRLLQVKGRRNVKVRQIELSARAMNKGDCFILDAGRNIYVWVGPQSGRTERLKAVMAADALKSDVHAGKSKIHVYGMVPLILETLTHGTISRPDLFFIIRWDDRQRSVLLRPGRFGVRREACFRRGRGRKFREVGYQGRVTAQVRASSFIAVSYTFSNLTLFCVVFHRISETNGKIKVTRVSLKPLKQEMLDSNDCFLLDTGSNGIFAWVGKKASKKERSESMRLATVRMPFVYYSIVKRQNRINGMN